MIIKNCNFTMKVEPQLEATGDIMGAVMAVASALETNAKSLGKLAAFFDDGGFIRVGSVVKIVTEPEISSASFDEPPPQDLGELFGEDDEDMPPLERTNEDC